MWSTALAALIMALLPVIGQASCTSTAQPGGQCGPSLYTCCPTGQCCSQYGWCGVTAGHCGTGCQAGFGACAGAAQAPSSSPSPSPLIPSPSGSPNRSPDVSPSTSPIGTTTTRSPSPPIGSASSSLNASSALSPSFSLSPSPSPSPSPSSSAIPSSGSSPPIAGQASCTSAAQPGGQCGSGLNICCPAGQCCSQYGWCGVTAGHCGAGCQTGFGMCAGAPQTPSSSPSPNPSPNPSPSPLVPDASRSPNRSPDASPSASPTSTIPSKSPNQPTGPSGSSLGASPSPIPSPSPSSSPNPSNSGSANCTSTAQPGGQCGSSINVCCPTGQCCSQYGWCGTTTAYCGPTCQTGFGACTGGSKSSSPSPLSPSPKGSPKPSPSPGLAVPSPGQSPLDDALVQGYYQQTWLATRNLSTNVAVAFSGWADVSNALADSAQVFGSLNGSKYLSIGGGNWNGYWTRDVIAHLDANLAAIQAAGYTGVCYDIEGGDAGLGAAFSASFEAAQAAGLKVLVTVSHSAPYDIADAALVMDAVFQSAAVDYLSPQLYTSGSETANDYSVAAGVPWAAWRAAKARVVASVASGKLWPDANLTFAAVYGITTYGYVAWN